MEKKDYIYGIRAIIEGMESGRILDRILIKREAGASLMGELIEKAKFYGVPVQKVPVEKLNRITMKNHQGAIAVISPTGYHKLDDIIPKLYEEGKNPMCVMLDGVTDARNYGAIARTCECAGVDFMIITEKGSASSTSDAIKASAGALFHLPVCREKDISTALSKLHGNGYKIIGASEKGRLSYLDADYTGPLAIVMGAEDKGLSAEVLRKCDEMVSIPIKGKIGSLNVSVAAGILIYEAVSKR